jgi:hypothetical protein
MIARRRLGNRQENLARLRAFMRDPVDANALATFLIAESRLPGPRANLELAADVARLTYTQENGSFLLPTFEGWLELEIIGHPAQEYLPVCALHGLGGLYLGASAPNRSTILRLLRQKANSENWRVRESVCMALQFVGERNPEEMMAVLRDWSPDATLLELRAVNVTLAHPPILSQHPEVTEQSFVFADQTIDRMRSISPMERKQEPFRVRAKAMWFAPSVLVAASPEKGFALLRKWASHDDLDISRILKENLKKNRLMSRYSAEVADLAQYFDGDPR